MDMEKSSQLDFRRERMYWSSFVAQLVHSDDFEDGLGKHAAAIGTVLMSLPESESFNANQVVGVGQHKSLGTCKGLALFRSS